MANSKFVRLYYSKVTEDNDEALWKAKLLIENHEDCTDELYESFNEFIENVEHHNYDIAGYFAITCVKTVADILYFDGLKHLSILELLRVDIDHLTLTLFDEWCENNEINLNELLF